MKRERLGERKGERQSDREAERDRDRETERERDREREREGEKMRQEGGAGRLGGFRVPGRGRGRHGCRWTRRHPGTLEL